MRDSHFKIVYVVGFVIGSVVRGMYTYPCKKSRVADSRRSAMDTALVGVASVGLLLPLVYLPTSWLEFADYRSPPWLGWVGTVVFAGALWLLWRAHVDLGRNWTVVPQITEGHSLVTGGVYRHIRHPMYAAHWLWGIAQALLLANWVVGPAMLVSFLPLYLHRVPREERMMSERFVEEYQAYVRRTGRIFPCRVLRE